MLEYDSDARARPGILQRMIGAISHRGPDGRGIHVSGPIGLGHARLAIIDLHTGSQPISNEDETIWIVYNGEVYNYRELRRELIEKGHKFRSTTDTEVIVHLYEEYGMRSLTLLRGMFAFALWDEREKTLLLARDRIGIKPLYYTHTNRGLVFGSEIKALLAYPQVKCEIEPQCVDKFLTHFCLPGPETLWKGIYKLEPGFYLQARGRQIKLRQYWDLQFSSGDARAIRPFDEAAEQLYDLTKRTVQDHMISDVPVGCLLSGGVDSTIVLSCAATETGKKINTFTVGFDNAAFEDERPYARLASRRFGTEHHETTVTAREFWEFLPSLVRHMEEPVCDPPAVALYYVSKLAQSHVKVLLSGEGGDEAFGGYYDYRNFLFLEKIKAAVPSLKTAMSRLLTVADRFAALRKVGKFAPFFVTSPQEYYYGRVASPFSFFSRNKSAICTSGFRAAVCLERSSEVIRGLLRRVCDQPLLNQMQYVDTKTSLPDDLLIKADRMTMANSMELRVPLLDHPILEFAACLPPAYRVRGFETKRILKKAFGNHIPKEILRRRKAGFPIPIERWIRRELRDEVRQILLSKQSLDRGFFRKSGIETLLALSDQGRPVAKEIFSLLTLELLFQQFTNLERPSAHDSETISRFAASA